jgi:hypothetical protein
MLHPLTKKHLQMAYHRLRMSEFLDNAVAHHANLRYYAACAYLRLKMPRIGSVTVEQVVSDLQPDVRSVWLELEADIARRRGRAVEAVDE